MCGRGGSTQGAEGAVDATTSSEIGVLESVVLKDFGDVFGGKERREVERTRESELVMLGRGKGRYRKGKESGRVGTVREERVESASIERISPINISTYSCDSIDLVSLLSASCRLR